MLRALATVVALMLFAACGPTWPDPNRAEIWHDSYGNTLVMDVKPIKVHAEESLIGPTKRAIGQWNGWLDMQLLVMVADSDEAHVNVGATTSWQFLAVTIVHSKNDRTVLTTTKDGTVMVHEFGHVLGLAHDPKNEKSVMFPAKQDKYLLEVEPQDIKVLKEHYGNLVWSY